jgi:hypothetical protein
MQDRKSEKPVRQQELPKKDEPVQQQPANDRPVGGEGVIGDERGQEQPVDKNRALRSN